MSDMERRVVITGCGVVSPVGISKAPFWESLIAGRSGIGKITLFDASRFDAQIAGEVKGFVPPAFVHPKNARRTPRFILYALKAAEEAILESGFDISRMDPYRAGVIIGSGIGCLDIVEAECQVYREKGPSRITPFLIPLMITNEAAGNVAIQFGLKGINFCTVTACASGAHGIGEGFLAVKYDRADIMVCGGTEASITHMGIGGFCAAKTLCSTYNDEPTRASRPFDKDRSGFVMSEGAGILIMEELEHAKKRGAPIYGEMAGYGATCDAYHITAPNPDGDSAAHAMMLAMKEAKAVPQKDIYINAHGTSTQLNDAMETRAIKKALGEYAKYAHINSTKSIIGHTLGAAGAIECITCCLALKNKVIHPTINYETPDPDCDLDYTPNIAREMDVKLVLSNSLGFGGHNATLCLKEYK